MGLRYTSTISKISRAIGHPMLAGKRRETNKFFQTSYSIIYKGAKAEKTNQNFLTFTSKHQRISYFYKQLYRSSNPRLSHALRHPRLQKTRQ